jgi:hypothetical protein
MADRITVPPFDIVSIEDASHAALKRLRVYVAIRPEDADELVNVAAKIVSDHAANNDAVVMFFYFSATDAGKGPSEARAQYVRNGMRQGVAPAPLKSERSLHRFKLPNGVVTVEAAREAVA